MQSDEVPDTATEAVDEATVSVEADVPVATEGAPEAADTPLPDVGTPTKLDAAVDSVDESGVVTPEEDSPKAPPPAPPSRLGMITPMMVAEAVTATPAEDRADVNWEDVVPETMVTHWHEEHGHALADKDSTMMIAQMSEGNFGDQEKDMVKVAHLYRDVLEIYPTDKPATEKLMAALTDLYPKGPNPVYKGNHTKKVIHKISKLEEKGRVVHHATWPRAIVYEVDGVIEADKVDSFRKTAHLFKQRWKQNPPIVCFQHDDYTALPELAAGWREPPVGGRGCLNSGYSRLVTNLLNSSTSPVSDSSLIYSGQSPMFEELGARVEKLTGLRHQSGYAWQLLEYPEGSNYKVRPRLAPPPSPPRAPLPCILVHSTAHCRDHVAPQCDGAVAATTQYRHLTNGASLPRARLGSHRLRCATRSLQDPARPHGDHHYLPQYRRVRWWRNRLSKAQPQVEANQRKCDRDVQFWPGLGRPQVQPQHTAPKRHRRAGPQARSSALVHVPDRPM